MSKTVGLVPTGTANTASVVAGFTRLGYTAAEVRTTSDIENADRLVLPGVGAFGAAISRIDANGWRRPLVERLSEGKATLAICLGMQLLCEKSEETPESPGLGILGAAVSRFDSDLVVPQLGWNRIDPVGSRYIEPGWAYFANSYRVTELPGGWSVAMSDYGGPFVAAVERDGVLACQFHPELSGPWGLGVLKKWLDQTEEGA